MNSVAGAEASSANSEIPGFSPGTFSVWGDIRFSADAFLRAKVQGNVQAARKLVLDPLAEVSGRVQGGDVCVQGKIEGGLEAIGQVWIKAGARLRKQCVAHSLRIEPGADFCGELKVGGGRA
ncbi:MAG: polymer-forming cytoskeletal protein [Verrucomicrobia bacterium]|nr:polymer-forming cytoskeletal protein [Verrucomicrobiota bacterium]